jgi:prephenate dehydrogenase
MAVIGIGQIGASFALAARRAGVVDRVIGVARKQTTRDEALGVGAADECTADVVEALGDADIVYVSVPVGAMRGVFEQIAPHLPAGCLVTDAGSTKAEVCRWAAQLLPETVSFIGGHPMAGTEKHGPAAASAELFDGTTYLLCPGRAAQPVTTRLESAIRRIGAAPLVVDPDQHDTILAYSSHLPHLVAVALSVAIARSGIEGIVRFSAGGLRDTTRIAAADVDMWRDIFAANSEAVLAATRAMREVTEEFIEAIETGDVQRVESLLETGRRFREKLYASPVGVDSSEGEAQDSD